MNKKQVEHLRTDLKDDPLVDLLALNGIGIVDSPDGLSFDIKGVEYHIVVTKRDRWRE